MTSRTDINVLKNLHLSLPPYCSKGYDVSRSYGSDVLRELENLKSLESHFLTWIRNCEANVQAAQASLQAAEANLSAALQISFSVP